MSTITVGCKIINGIILRHQGKSVTLAGAGASRIIGGYGLTEGVDKEFFDAWCAANADSALLSGELVFAQDKAGAAAAQAKEQEDVKSGFEALDMAKPAAGVSVDADVHQQAAA